MPWIDLNLNLNRFEFDLNWFEFDLNWFEFDVDLKRFESFDPVRISDLQARGAFFFAPPPVVVPRPCVCAPAAAPRLYSS